MAAPSKKIVLAFDLYGTLLSTDSIAARLAEHFGEEKAKVVSTSWRRYQLEYTWRLNSMEKFIPFFDVTRQSLQHALGESSLSLSETEIDALMKSYDHLDLFPDVGPALETLQSHPLLHSQSLTPLIFSNGQPSMLTASIRHSPSLSPYASLFKHVVSTNPLKRYKPHPAVYLDLASRSLDRAEGSTVTPIAGDQVLRDVVLVSGNPFDVIGAKAVGLRAIWVDRAGNGWVDRLGGEGREGRPDEIVRGLGEVVEVVERWLEG